jgi:hypothetical protein
MVDAPADLCACLVGELERVGLAGTFSIVLANPKSSTLGE